VDDFGETVGLMWPNSNVLASHWLIRLETKDGRGALRARTSLAQWNSDHSRKELLFELEPAAMGAATVSLGWDRRDSVAPALRLTTSPACAGHCVS
jgi:hypothetical protein